MHASDRWLLHVLVILRGVLHDGPLGSVVSGAVTGAPVVCVVCDYLRSANLRPHVSCARGRFPGLSDRLGQAATALIQRLVGLGCVGYAWAYVRTEAKR